MYNSSKCQIFEDAHGLGGIRLKGGVFTTCYANGSGLGYLLLGYLQGFNGKVINVGY